MSMRLALGCLLMCLGLPALAGECVARSGERTAALVELYTSEGCSSCPPADRWLSTLGRRGYAPERVVPLSLHVDYWDYIGWKDPYAKREFSLRQRKLSQLQRLALVYTPQVLLQGRDFRDWAGSEFDTAVARINRLSAKARISLEIGKTAGDSLEVGASAELVDPSLGEQAALYLAAYENRLTSQVNVGENRGRVLEHGYVVLEWQGPLAFDAAGRIQVRRQIPLLPNAISAHSGVVAFVQNRRSTEVLQALMLPAC
jgi:hypothetical protein